jgi:hypothetical protein
MALDPKITSIKAAGTYRFEFDKSQVVSIPAEQTRLIIGFSKQGPVNTPVFVPDTSFFKQVFGDIDRNLEKKDSYFQRSCLTALERGPILALNLLRLDQTDDQIEFIKFQCAATPYDLQDNDTTGAADMAPYSSFFNKDKFWYPDTDSFLTAVGANTTTFSGVANNNLLDFTNIGKLPISVIVKKADAQNTTGFNVTVKEWYGTANVPGYLDGDSLISDFMIDVYVLEGNWGGDFGSATPYERFDSDPTFQGYFDVVKGIQRKKVSTDASETLLREFFNEDEVNLQAIYTCSLLPNFVDLLGNNLFVENVINADTATTGLFCTVNEDLFDGEILIDGMASGIDMIGHNLEYTQNTEDQDAVNFLSYEDTIVANLEFCGTMTATDTTIAPAADGNVTTNTNGDIVITITGGPTGAVYSDFITMAAGVQGSSLGSYIQENAGTQQFVPVTNVNVVGNTVTVTLSSVGTAVGAFNMALPLTYINAADIDQVAQEWGGAAATDNIIGSMGSDLYTAYANGSVTDGDEITYGEVFALGATTTQSWLSFATISYEFFHLTAPTGAVPTPATISDPDYWLPSVQVTAWDDAAFSAVTPYAEFNIDNQAAPAGPAYAPPRFFWPTNGATAGPGAINCLVVQSLKGSMNQTYDILADSTTEPLLYPNQVLVAAPNTDIIVGNYLVHCSSCNPAGTDYSRLTRINVVKGGQTNAEFPAAIPVNTTALLVECQSEIEIRPIGGTDTVEVYYPIDAWIDYLNIFCLPGFVLRADYSVPNGSNDRQNEILNDTLGGTPLFKALIDRDVINYRYVVDTFGNGIEAGSKSIYYTLCQDRKNAFAITNAPSAKDFKDSTDPKFTDALGSLSSKFIAEGGDLALNPTIRYSLPSIPEGASWGAFYYPFITVRDLGRNINVPPASYVSNNFIDKYANALPWSIVAGVRRGVIGGNGVVGLELNLNKGDREYLEPFGLNPIVFQSGAGPTIFANKTAQQTMKSALSSINCREVVIYIQDGIEAILKNYLFEFNTPQTRLEIKTLADNFLSTVQNDDGVYDFRNVMDETNNPPSVIDQNIGILDTYIEPVRGMEILVQRTTILKTGAISTGNFQ